MDVVATFFANLKKNIFSDRFKYGLRIVLIISVVVLPTFFGYTWWRDRIESAASKELGELLERYEALQKHKNDTYAFVEFKDACDKAFQTHHNSTLQGYFGILSAFGFLGSSKEKDLFTIQQLFKQGLSKLKVSNPYHMIFSISYANLLLMYGNSEQKKEALDILTKCSAQKNHPLHVMAIYYHGLYLFHEESLQAAENVWKSILYDPKYSDSPVKEMIVAAKNLEEI